MTESVRALRVRAMKHLSWAHFVEVEFRGELVRAKFDDKLTVWRLRPLVAHFETDGNALARDIDANGEPDWLDSRPSQEDQK